jgi:gamma-glutamyltranspeptidase/glutathione hydrolase
MTLRSKPLLAAVLGAVLAAPLAFAPLAQARMQPARGRLGMVATEHGIASQVGVQVLWDGGNAVDAAVASAFALAVTLPTAGNIGGGGFIVYRPAKGEPVAYDFRETAPAAASPTMFLVDGRYDTQRHHESHVAVGVPGSVAGLYMAWKAHGRLPWKQLVRPAVQLARDGFMVTEGLSRSLKGVLEEMKKRGYQASVEQFSRKGVPYEMGDLLRQPDLARTLERIAERGPDGFYRGETADLIVREMKRGGGLITHEDLRAYTARRREPLRGSYRGYEVLTVPPPSSGGVALLEMLNVLEGYDLAARGFGSAAAVHVTVEAMRRAYADRARHLGDPDFNPGLPVSRLISKPYAEQVRATIREDHASVSTPTTFEWPAESPQTTHLAVVDADRNAVSLTTTLEDGYGSKIVVPGAGFLLNNEMGDFNAAPGLTDATGLIGTDPNLAAPGKRMLSSMSPTILARDGKPFLVAGSMGGRTIINTVLQIILDVVDYGMNVQDALDAPRYHHQWLPDQIAYEKDGLSPDTIALLRARGHDTRAVDKQGHAQAIVFDAEKDMLEGAADGRAPDSAAIGR